jgi:hypothetical protein
MRGNAGRPSAVTKSRVVSCLDTARVASLAGVNRSTLDYWIRTGLVEPSLRSFPGRRRTRLWTIQDAVVVRAIAVLRLAGCPLQQVRRARARIEATWGRVGADATLAWDGSDILRVDREGAVESLLKYPGQQVFRPVALPIALWHRETRNVALFIRWDKLSTGIPRSTRELATRAV